MDLQESVAIQITDQWFVISIGIFSKEVLFNPKHVSVYVMAGGSLALYLKSVNPELCTSYLSVSCVTDYGVFVKKVFLRRSEMYNFSLGYNILCRK